MEDRLRTVCRYVCSMQHTDDGHGSVCWYELATLKADVPSQMTSYLTIGCLTIS